MPRIKQSFSPFVVLFQYDKEKLKEFIHYTQLYNKEIIEENATSFDGQIFNAYLELLEKHDIEQQTFDDYKFPCITSSDIRAFLIDNGWKEDKITASVIGKRLKSLGFKSKPMKISGRTKKMLEIDENLLKNLISRYVVTAVTEVTLDTEPIINNNNNSDKENVTDEKRD